MKPTSNSDSQRSLPGIRPPKIFADGLDVSDVVDVVTADIAAEDVIDDTPPTETTDVGVSDIGTKDIGGLSDELPEFGESASADLIPTASEPTEQTAVIASDGWNSTARAPTLFNSRTDEQTLRSRAMTQNRRKRKR